MESSDFEDRKKQVQAVIKIYPDFPKKGVDFVDYFSILYHPKESKILDQLVIETIDKHFADKVDKFNVIVGLETRGFFLGIVLSQHYNLPFVPIRKKGKLPGDVESFKYTTEYSSDEAEIQKQSLTEDSRVLILDDLLATGGTLSMANNLVIQCGAKVALNFIVFEIMVLEGRKKLENPDSVISLYEY
mmetsp:Transcript_17822/g.15731  ORF Transcript_17822/g.15731 Transcript_17822/m.15731 type:complete len:188 (-) Transcript_17822:16-579(-)